MATAITKKLMTIGEIARRANATVFQIQHVVDSRGFRPSGRANTLRVFSEADAEAIIEVLNSIRRDRGGKRA